ncbi:MAG: YitT family protein [Anaerolineae bacterium]|nr:YitT family protein [Anaerolineae bacterium]MDW8171903.1 YitT family protein [Anaerolineae bacterium]
MNKRLRDFFLTYFVIIFGAALSGLAVVIFLAPFNIAPSGVSGIALILNHLFGLPIGIMVLILNIPIQIFAIRTLANGWTIVWRTIVLLVVYSLVIDLMRDVLPVGGISDDRLLNTIFGGIVTGIASGIVYRVGGTFGGTSTLALILQKRLGLPMSSTFLYTDMAVVGLAALVFGIEGGLYATIMLFVAGATTDYVLEGPSVVRTCVIITDQPQVVAEAVMKGMGRGVTGWQATGMYTQQPRHVLYVTVARSQVTDLLRTVQAADPRAFMVVGQGHTAYGRGFNTATID